MSISKLVKHVCNYMQNVNKVQTPEKKKLYKIIVYLKLNTKTPSK